MVEASGASDVCPLKCLHGIWLSASRCVKSLNITDKNSLVKHIIYCTDKWCVGLYCFYLLTLILLTWRIWWAPNNASRWQMGFNLAFNGLIFSQHGNSGRLRWTFSVSPAGCNFQTNRQKACVHIPYFSIDNARVIYTKRSKFVKNEHARYTLERYER